MQYIKYSKKIKLRKHNIKSKYTYITTYDLSEKLTNWNSTTEIDNPKAEEQLYQPKIIII